MSRPSVDVDLPVAAGASSSDALLSPQHADGPTFHLSPAAATAAAGLSSAPASPIVARGSGGSEPTGTLSSAHAHAASAASSLPPRSQSIMVTGTSNRVLHKGVLTKLGNSLLSTWRTRFFVLREQDFTYHASERDWVLDKAPLGRLQTSGLRCWSQTPTDLEWKFVAPDKTVVVRGTLEDKKTWYDVVEQHRQRNVAMGRASGAAEGNTDLGEGNSGRPPSPSLSRTGGGSTLSAGGRSRSGSMIDRDPVSVSGHEGGDDMADLFTSARESAGPEAVAARTVGSAGGADVGPLGTPSSKRTDSTGTVPAAAAAAAPPPGTPIDPAEAERRRSKRLAKSRKAQQIFGWGPDEQVIKDFSCALHKVIMLHGKMYITRRYIAFESTLFSGSKLCVPVADVLSVCEANQAIIFPNALKLFVRVHAEDQLPGGGGVGAESAGSAGGAGMDGSYFFGSFAPGGRQAAFDLINSLLNNTFNPDKYGMGEEVTSAARNAVQGGQMSRQGSVSSLSTDGDEFDDDDAVSDEAGPGASSLPGDGDADADGSLPASGSGPSSSKLRSHLDFGEHRGSVSGTVAAQGADSEVRQLLDETLPGISAQAFYRLFVADSALYNAEMYHKSRGHTEYQASGWKDARLVEGASAQGWTLVRDTMVRVPLVGAPMGPDSTRVLKVQKCNTSEAGQVRLETVAVTPDVPFGDCFVIVDEWVVTDLPGPGVGCRVRVQLSVRFVKSNWKLRAIKSMMLSRVFGENETGFRAHIDAMRQWAETHTAEVAAVHKALSGAKGGAPHAKVKSTTQPASAVAAAPTTNTPVSTTKVVTTAASQPSPSAGTGSPLDSLVLLLPPSLQKLGTPTLAGIGVALLLFVILGFWSMASPATSAAVAAGAGAPGIPTLVPGADGVSSTVIAVVPAAAALPWWATLLLIALLGAAAGLALKLNQLERDVTTLKQEVKALQLARK